MAWQYAALAAYQVTAGLQNAQMIRRQADITDQINELNAKYAEQDAFNREAYDLGEIAKYETKVNETMSAQRVAYAAADVDQSYGTAAAVTKESETNSFLNVLDMKSTAAARARGFQREIRGMRIGAQIQRGSSDIAAAGAMAQGIGAAAATGISGYTKNR